MLEIKNLTKKFEQKTILDNVNLSLKDGEILSIVGPSGGGKTTLLRCISGLEKMDSGEILIDGEVVDPMSKKDVENTIGVVFQEFHLFPHLSVMDNLILAPTLARKTKKEAAKKEAERLLSLLDLADKADSMPYQLSGGQKQRVAIARALAMNPKVLLFDEPTSALDPDLRDHVASLILSLKQVGITQIIVTHDHAFAEKIADQMLEVEPLKKEAI
ncbi:amino acid ABC transporter ATP-binding protein [Listeria sp. FSL L7-1485]|uniref:Amino acid ABC transporter ATP-binding protein n=1 Tax=Listeria immobilis TaxID=2713502 RepID=A0A7X0X976_9LIST|nr:amino acid ABC transporter ATP-binding protein [Listeria immobilis]MBC1483382.1 amino acid ABC transporter ATP-binding protein [Listeria immobilis]MBC1489476.1 amino acid ABC transporter ATP-binding protein [Listeria immobilis]MBC1507636.1 amino acid ABC transporter ATP-binding protein [Listeria immobilis]MBC1510501.1 amino acid ABC transporter ATP-binding protein [Listeria immobilis]MBC1516709.1 amino acid ABC transporter ATP-binding protein [Listeria immobilis]